MGPGRLAVSQRLLENQLAREPRSLPAQRYLSDTYSIRAQLAAAHGRHIDAIPDWDRAIGLAPPPAELRHLRINRLLSLVATSSFDRALNEAADLATDEALTPDDAFFVARHLALASATHGADSALPESRLHEIADQYTEQAVRMLRKAAERGFFRDRPWHEFVEGDQILALLRGREDYRRVVIEFADADNSPPAQQ